MTGNKQQDRAYLPTDGIWVTNSTYDRWTQTLRTFVLTYINGCIRILVDGGVTLGVDVLFKQVFQFTEPILDFRNKFEHSSEI